MHVINWEKVKQTQGELLRLGESELINTWGH